MQIVLCVFEFKNAQKDRENNKIKTERNVYVIALTMIETTIKVGILTDADARRENERMLNKDRQYLSAKSVQ